MMVAKSFVVVNELVEYENDVQSAAAGREKRRGGRGSAAAAACSRFACCLSKKKWKIQESRGDGVLFLLDTSGLKRHIDAYI